MKTSKYNKSAIMKEAHYWRAVLGYTMSEALAMAWRNAKSAITREKEAMRKYEADQAMREERAKKTIVADMSHLASSLVDYYNRGSSAYYGD